MSSEALDLIPNTEQPLLSSSVAAPLQSQHQRSKRILSSILVQAIWQDSGKFQAGLGSVVQLGIKPKHSKMKKRQNNNSQFCFWVHSIPTPKGTEIIVLKMYLPFQAHYRIIHIRKTWEQSK